ncbi:MAG: glycoside hydrolase family 43 protein [Bacteroidota bacterium]
MKYQNPVIPGFYPDPSVCRAGGDYYLVTSSFEYFPGVPVFHSRDLVHWRQIGHCLTRRGQLDLEGVPSSCGIYAPTIRYHAGRFYMTTTNVTRGGNFYVWTEDPGGEWSEPIWVDQGGIDPSLFFDDDGRVYFTSNGGGDERGIYQCEIEIATGRRLTESRYIWSGTGGAYPEAPHLYKINGLYYLMIAEGGTEYGHMETIARSAGPYGPFEPCPYNPILSHRSLDSPIQATGHADLLQAHDGSWWLYFLGIRPVSYPPCHHLGRETFLSPVSWHEGWPLVGENGHTSLEVEAALPPSVLWPSPPVRDDFDAPILDMSWNFLRNPHAEDWSLTDRPGWLRLTGSAVTLDEAASPAFIGRRQQHFDCRAGALLDFEPRLDGEEAGLTVLMNERHHYEIAVTRLDGEKSIIVRRRIGSLAMVVAKAAVADGPVVLGIDADPSRYRFIFHQGEGEPKTLAEGETRYLSKEVAGGFTGVYFGLYATGNGKRSTAPAYFDWFAYEGG